MLEYHYMCNVKGRNLMVHVSDSVLGTVRMRGGGGGSLVTMSVWKSETENKWYNNKDLPKITFKMYEPCPTLRHVLYSVSHPFFDYMYTIFSCMVCGNLVINIDGIVSVLECGIFLPDFVKILGDIYNTNRIYHEYAKNWQLAVTSYMYSTVPQRAGSGKHEEGGMQCINYLHESTLTLIL